MNIKTTLEITLEKKTKLIRKRRRSIRVGDHFENEEYPFKKFMPRNFIASEIAIAIAKCMGGSCNPIAAIDCLVCRPLNVKYVKRWA